MKSENVEKLTPNAIPVDDIRDVIFRSLDGKKVEAVIEAAENKNDAALPILGAEKVRPRQMTQELLRRNRHLESIIDSISDGIIEVYAARVVYANPAAGFLFGQPPESLVGSSFPQLFDDGYQSRITTLMVGISTSALTRKPGPTGPAS